MNREELIEEILPCFELKTKEKRKKLKELFEVFYDRIRAEVLREQRY